MNQELTRRRSGRVRLRRGAARLCSGSVRDLPARAGQALGRSARDPPHAQAIQPDASVEEALRSLRAERIGALVVSGDGARLVGLASERDILHTIADRGVGVLSEGVGSVMAGKVFTCSRADNVSSVMALMTDRRVRHVPVVGKDGRLGGRGAGKPGQSWRET